MGRRAGVITVDLSLGQAQFMTDLVKSKVAIQDFGRTAKFSMAESTAAVKALEGNFGGTTRAVSRFLSVTLGLGPVLSAAFPVIGALMLGKAIADTAIKVHEFFKDLAEGPEKIAKAFREMNEPLHVSNDELRVVNDRLQNDIDKLEGRRQNTLKLALDEARVAADKLAEALDKDLDKINQLLKEQQIGAFKEWAFGSKSTSEDTKDIKKFVALVDTINAEGAASVRAAKSKEDAAAAQSAWNQKLLGELDSQIGGYKYLVDETERLQRLHLGTEKPKNITEKQRQSFMWTGQYEQNDYSGLAAERRGTLQNLQSLRDRIALGDENTGLMQRKDQDEANAAARKLSAPFEKAMQTLRERLMEAKGALAEIGQSNDVKVMMAAALEVDKEIAKINQERKAMDQGRQGPKESGQMEALALQGKQVKSIADTKKQFDEATKSTKEQLAAQQLLTSAIGKGYEATKAAAVEGQLMGENKEHLGDNKWMADHDAQIKARRQEIALAYEAKQVTAGAGEEDRIRTQIELEAELVKAEMKGAFAVRLATHEFSLSQIAKDKDAESVRKLTAAENERFAIDTAKIEAASIKQTTDKIAAIERLTAAQFKGADAIHKAAMANKEAGLTSQFGPGSPAIKSGMAEEEAQYQLKITEKAAQRVGVYTTLLHDIEQERVKIMENAKAGGDQLETARALLELENERVHTLSQQALAMRDAKDGLRAFFLDMQASAKSSAEILYGSLHSALDRVSDEMANLFTGRKTNFKQMVNDLFHEATKESIKSGLQTGLGGLGKKIFGADFGSKRGDTVSRPTYVWVTNLQGTQLAGLPMPGAGGWGGLEDAANSQRPFDLGKIFGGSAGGGIFNMLGSLLGLGHRAGGGDVSPGSAYIVGERGPEILTGASGRVVSAAALSRASGGGGNHYYSIDARGTDPVQTEMRVRNAILAAHDSAVGTGFLVQQDHLRRSPVRS